MSARTIAECVLLAVMAFSALLSVIGLVRARDALAAVHCAGFAAVSVIVPFFVAVAVAKLGSEATVKAFLLLALTMCSAPITSHALGRAIFLRSRQ